MTKFITLSLSDVQRLIMKAYKMGERREKIRSVWIVPVKEETQGCNHTFEWEGFLLDYDSDESDIVPNIYIP